VSIRDSGALLNLTKAESLVLSGTTKDVREDGLTLPWGISLDAWITGFGPVVVRWNPRSWLVRGHNGAKA
jgi:hypothetical protein